MHRLLVPFALLLLAGTACTKYPYVALLDGDWTGQANDAAGGAYPLIASFQYDEKEEKYPLTGQVDFNNGYIVPVYSAKADKESASVDLTNSLVYLKLTGVTVEDTKMKGKFEFNSCYSTDPEGAGVGCSLTGAFDAEMQ